MYSVRDLPKEGFPHSEICGSTIARISPQLIAACHVLHRLLAPRHPPNALYSLYPSATRTQDQHAKALAPACIPRMSNRTTANTETLHSLTPANTSPAPPVTGQGSGRQPARATQHTRSSSPVKEHERPPRPGFPPGARPCLPKTTPHRQEQASARSTTRPQPEPSRMAWRRSVSNRRPPACKAGALPLSYAPSSQPRRTANPNKPHHRQPHQRTGGPGRT